ncbi:MAG: hypothetical protein V4613_07660 [Bacteroidota bacterium]
MEHLFTTIVNNNALHSKWLNTLSMMENAGAKKIKNCEHPVLVNEIILKHSAEEARHAYYLKKQISKLQNESCPTYEKKYLMAPDQSYFYLHALDVQVCRYLKNNYGYKGDDLKYAAYLLVTYAIEVRADDLYPKYQAVLTAHGCKVNVKTIIAEEENHLHEMKQQLEVFSPNWHQLCEDALQLETALYNDWIKALEKEVAA